MADSIAMDESFDPYKKWLGIAPKDQPPNHYRLLGVDLFELDPDVISNAADQRMVHMRTFQQGRHATLSQGILNELATARHCLLSENARAEYDIHLRAELDSKLAKPPVRITTTSDGTSPQPDQPSPASSGSAFESMPVRQQSKKPLFIALASIALLLVVGGVTSTVLLLSADPGENPIQVSVPVDDDPNVTPVTEGDDSPRQPNDAPHPVLAPIRDIIVQERQPLEFDIPFAGDSPHKGYHVQIGTATDGATVNAATGRFHWTPTAATRIGSHSVAIDLVDLQTKSIVSNVTFNVIVMGVDRRIVMKSVAEQWGELQT